MKNAFRRITSSFNVRGLSIIEEVVLYTPTVYITPLPSIKTSSKEKREVVGVAGLSLWIYGQKASYTEIYV